MTYYVTLAAGRPEAAHLAGQPIRARRVAVASLDEASAVVRAFVSEYELGSSSWYAGGEDVGRVVDAGGEDVGRVAYNGRVFAD